MHNVLECHFWCNDAGTDESDRLGIEDPPAVKRRGTIRLDRVIAFNEDVSREEPSVWAYFDDVDCIAIAMPYDEFKKAYIKWANHPVYTGRN